MSYPTQDQPGQTGGPTGPATAAAADGVSYEERSVVKPAKTSVPAALSLAFGAAALTLALTVIFGPIGIVLGVIGLLLGIFGFRNSRRSGVTGRWVALAGLVTSLVAVLLGASVALGVTYFFNNEQALARVERQIDQWRQQVSDTPAPTTTQ